MTQKPTPKLLESLDELRAQGIQFAPVLALKAWAMNPNRHEPGVPRLLRIIQRFGWTIPLVVRAEPDDSGQHEISAGHGRLLAAAGELGLEEVPVIYRNFSEHDSHAYGLADNKAPEFSADDPAALQAVLDELLANDGEQDILDAGWTPADLEELMVRAGGPEGSSGGETPEETPVPEPPADPVTKPGDVWVMGDHRLICGSCREPADVAKLLEGRKVNVAFTSPPYASQRKYDESSGFKPIPPAEYVDWFEAVQANVREVLADDGSWFVNIKEHCEDGQRSLYVKDLTLAHAREWGWRYVDELVWKRNTVPGKFTSRFKNLWEPVFHFSAQNSIKFRPKSVAHASMHAITYDAGRHFGNDADGYSTVDASAKRDAEHEGTALPGNVLECSQDQSSGHSAPFPVRLPTFFIKAYSDPGDLIFDPFMGSGTTMIAAENEGRHAVGCEISPAYCDVIVQRWENLTGRKATLEGSDA